VRILSVDIPKLDGFPAAKFDILKPRWLPTTEKKDTDRLNLGVPGDAPAWLDSMRRTLDFQLKQLAYRARIGKLEGVRLVGGALVVSPLESEVPDCA
jgi:hypothetical protein